MDDILQTPIVEEVEQSFLDYSMSVITDRAIPSVEDGFKPVVRRILWSMYEDGNTSTKPYRKCAEPVGNTMGNYHPHGDSSIYGALVAISQPWNMRYPLLDFHGNNGSRDGDGPAAYRYTEVRLNALSEATMADIKKNTVDWIPNYAESKDEPIYLPGRFPNLLCNGTTGIAVAMACSFAPHNLNEVMDAAVHLLKNPTATIDDLLGFIKGPDFPTGCTVINQDELRAAYVTGKGRARMRADYVVERNNGRDTLVFTSIPYKVSKEDLIAEIDNLCEEKKIEGITEIRDESNKKGLRFVVELAKGINADVIASKLYQLTNLEDTYSYNQVALVGKSPKLLNLKQILEYYLLHQQEVFMRRTQFDLDKLHKRIHILRGIATAIENIDEVIKLIKESDTSSNAKMTLIKRFSFSDEQAQAILDMKLSKLAHTEKIAIDNEIAEKVAQALIFEEIIENPEKAKSVLIEELLAFKKAFSQERKTTITQLTVTADEKEIEGIVPEECVVLVTEAGNIKRIPSGTYKAQKRNGKGTKNQDEIVKTVIKTNSIDALMIFSSFGKVYRLPVIDIPEGTNLTRGVAIETLIAMENNEKFITLASITYGDSNQFVWFFTKNGLVKKTNLSEYAGIKRKTGIIALGLREGDELIQVLIHNNADVILFSKNGMCIRFDGSTVGTTSRTATGVKGITLLDGDSLVAALHIDDNIKSIALAQKDGMVKNIITTEFAVQARGGKGVYCAKNTQVVGAIGINTNDFILLLGDKTSICINETELPSTKKENLGVKAIKNSNIVALVKV